MPSVEERLAVVETEVKAIKEDVTEIKGDVKALLSRAATSAAFGSLGKFVIPGAAFLISLAAFIRGG